MPTAFFLRGYGFLTSLNLEKSYSFLIASHLLLRRFAGGNDANKQLVFSVTMNDDQNPSRRAQSEKDETHLFVGMVRVMEQASAGVVENGLSFFKPNSVLG